MSDTLEELKNMVEDQTYLKFDSETEEKLIVGYFYKDRSTFLRLAQYMTTTNWQKHSLFNNKYLQFLVNICYAYSNAYKKMPAEKTVFSMIEKKITDKTMFIFDEPTTGLHTYDVDKLMKMIEKIVDIGATAVIIEHNLDVIKMADYIIDLGPNGGDGGGQIVATGTPEEVMLNENSATAPYLKKVLVGSWSKKNIE